MIPFPENFRSRMTAALGKEFSAFERSHETRARTSVRVNPRKPALPTSELTPVPWASNGFFLSERPTFTLDPFFHAGAYYVQEASSMFLEQVIRQHVSADEPLRVLDLCAAPGGKSTHLLSLLNSESLLVSNEVIRSRVPVLSENIQKWGFHNVVVTNNDASDFSRFEGYFDIIVLDAPCSGEGLFRKNPEAMKEWSEENVLLCAQRQQRIIQDIWPALKENGVLVYSTCTYNEREDEDIMRFIESEYECEPLPLNLIVPGITEVRSDQGIGYKFYPHKIEGEGFFISAIRKREPTRDFRIKPGKIGFDPAEKRIREEVKEWLTDEHNAIVRRNDLIQVLPERYVKDIEYMAQQLRIAYAGTFLATAKHAKLVPDHALSMSTLLKRSAFPAVELNEKEALKYLAKEPPQLNTEVRGFTLALYNGLPIGWMNILGNRINNLYPSDWRIRMKVD